jgi:hypothetical protein
MKVRYFCHGCQRNKEIDAPVRGEGEHIVKWMDRVAKAVSEDHTENSPNCYEGKADLMLRTDGDKPIGTVEGSIPPELMSKYVKESSN